jgi:hypothetical protein
VKFGVIFVKNNLEKLTIFNNKIPLNFMTKTFAEKSRNKTFLGMFALVSATSILFNSCNQKKDKKESEKLIPKDHPVAKIVPKLDDENVPSDKRVIYLTFDDGPNRGTENLLKILHKRNLRHRISCRQTRLWKQKAAGRSGTVKKRSFNRTCESQFHARAQQIHRFLQKSGGCC